MNRRTVTLLAILALALPGLAAAQLTPPSPATSTVPSYIMVCPSGDTSANIILRDAAGNRCIAYPVTLQFNPAAFGPLCLQPGMPWPAQTVNTDLAGRPPFTLLMGGFAPGGAATLTDAITGALIANIPVVVSPDQNGDCVVNLTDIAMFANAYNSGYTMAADLNQDGILNLADVTLLAGHVGH